MLVHPEGLSLTIEQVRNRLSQQNKMKILFNCLSWRYFRKERKRKFTVIKKYFQLNPCLYGWVCLIANETKTPTSASFQMFIFKWLKYQMEPLWTTIPYHIIIIFLFWSWENIWKWVAWGRSGIPLSSTRFLSSLLSFGCTI